MGGPAHRGRLAGCLQVALTCTQIWWTTEVGLAFARLEEGYENAIRDYNKKQVRAWGPGPPTPRAAAPPAGVARASFSGGSWSDV